jgi:serine/threonine protein kinase
MLGVGQFSVVKACLPMDGSTPVMFKDDTHRFAVKIITKERILKVDDVHQIEVEIKALKVLKGHKNIIEYKDCLHGSQAIYILTEIMPMDLVSNFLKILTIIKNY